ncbi:MAG: serine/threonine protein kinase [Deltaproteobacteria bacterium]|nr:serine/threonine protein kinase [Deltaproteobacteria bacterium]
MTITNNFILSNENEETQVYDVQGLIYEGKEVISSQANSIIYKAVLPNYENLALDVSMPQAVAIKLFLYDNKYPYTNIKLSLRESGALQRIKHANVIRFYDITQEEDFAFLALEFIDGIDLGTYLRQLGRPMPVKQSIYYLRQALLGLEAVHNAGVIHRDIKPENIMLTKNGAIKIIDFTTALIPGDMYPMVKNNEAIGTFDYIAPECLEGRANTKESDIYALGITFYQMLTNRMPFNAKSFNDQLKEKFAGHYTPVNKIVKKAPQVLTAMIDRAICPDPAGRYHNAREFLQDIRQYERTIDVYSSRYEQQSDDMLASQIELMQTQPKIKNDSIKTYNVEEMTKLAQQKMFGRFTQICLMVSAAATLLILIWGYHS